MAYGADFEKGLACYQKKDFMCALAEFRPLAEQGNSTAQYNLGTMYDNGYGVKQDYFEAAKWFRKAATQGLFIAQYNLGVAYDGGQGVRQDYFKAVKWYRKAAEQGWAKAQFNLGCMTTRAKECSKTSSRH